MSDLLVRDLGRCPYAPVLTLQEELVARKIDGDDADYLLLLEHEPVYTLGRGADPADLCGADQRLGVSVHRVGRGGGVTFHGPGQLVAYPILSLTRGGRDVHRYVRQLEDVLLQVCAAFGVAAARREGLAGAWVADRKIAAVGIGVRRWTTFHGVALNVDPDLRFFEAVVPCRVPGMQVTSLARELRSGVPPMAAVRAVFEQVFRAVFGYGAAVGEACRT
jgi:lipoate-protein ligase B